MSVLYLPDCPTDCSSPQQPVSFSTCAPEYHWGRFQRCMLPLPTYSRLTLPAWLNGHHALLIPGDDKIRTLVGIGEMPEPEVTEIATSGDRKAYSSRQYTINFTIDETNHTNYAWMAMTGCNTNYQFWFETSDGMLYSGGPDSGLEGTAVFHQIIPKNTAGTCDLCRNFQMAVILRPIQG